MERHPDTIIVGHMTADELRRILDPATVADRRTYAAGGVWAGDELDSAPADTCAEIQAILFDPYV